MQKAIEARPNSVFGAKKRKSPLRINERAYRY